MWREHLFCTIVFTVAAVGAANPAQATSDFWKADASGNWVDTIRWTSGNSPGSISVLNNTDVATFGTLLGYNRTVTIDANRNIGSITFSHLSDNKKYTLSGGNLRLSSGGVIQSTSTSGTHTDTISTPIEIQGDGGTATLTANAIVDASVMSIGPLTGVSTAGKTTTLTLNGANTGANAITGIIGDGLSGGKLTVVKDGTGAWTLSGINTFSGGLILNAGALIMSNTMETEDTTTNAQLGAGTLRLNGGILASSGGAARALTNNSVVGGDFTFGKAAGDTGRLTLSGNMDLGSSTRQITVDNASDVISGVISGAAGAGITKAGTGTLALAGANTYSGGTILNEGKLNINHAKAIGAGVFTINGGAIGNSSNAAVSNFNNNAQNWNADLTFDGKYNLDLGTGTVALAGNRSVISTYSYNVLTVGGIIDDGSSTYSLTKAGAGALTLAGANTYGGGTILNEGKLNINHAKALGTGVFTINGGTLDNSAGTTVTNANNNPQVWNGDFTFHGTKHLDIGTGAVTLGGNLTVSNNYNTLTVGGIIDDGVNTYGLTKAGAGALTLAGANTYGGGTILNEGKLNINHAKALGTGVFTINGGAIDNSSSSAITNAYNNAQNWNGDFAFHGTRNLDIGSGAVSLGGNRTISNSYSTLTVGGIIDDGVNTYGLTKLGAGSLTLTGANTYGGTTTISGGALMASNALALQNSTLNYTSAGSGTIKFGINSSAFTLGGLTGDKNLALTNAGGVAIALTVGNNANDTTYGGVLSAGGRLIKTGGGTLTLSGINTYTGGTTIAGGTLSVAISAALGLESKPLTIGAGATLKAADSFNTSRPTTLGGAGAGMGGTLEVADGKTLDYTSSSVINGSGSLIKTGAGTLSLGGVDTYTGGTYIKAGTLVSTSSRAPGPQPEPGSNLYAHHIYDGAALRIAAGSWASERQIELVGDLAGAGGASQIDITTGFIQQRNGLIYGAGRLQLVGHGKMIVTNPNTYAGGTLVENGVFQVNNSTGSGAGSGAVTVRNNGTLSGFPTAQGVYAGIYGSVSGPVEIQDDGTLSTLSGGTLTLGGLTLDEGARSTFQLGAPTVTPLVNITGHDSFSLAGDSTIEIVNDGSMGIGTYHLIDYTGSALVDISHLTLVSSHSGLFEFTLVNNTGNTSIDLLVAAIANQWKKHTGNDNWSNPDNWWTGEVPNGAGADAHFSNNGGEGFGSAAETVTIDTSMTVGSIAFNNTDTAFTIEAADGRTLTFDESGGDAVMQVFINAPNSANHVISAPVILSHNLMADIASGTYGLDISGDISGIDKTLTKTGSGPLALSGGSANTYNGLTEVGGGTLNLNKAPGLDAIGSGGLQIDDGATVTLRASNQIADPATVIVNGTFALGTCSETVASLDGGGAVTMDTGSVLTLGSSTDSSFLGTLSGGGGIAKTGAGRLTLNGINSYSGGTAINAGTLQVGADNNFGDPSGEVAFDGGTLFFSGSFTSSRNMLLNSSGTLDTDGSGITLTGVIRGGGSLTKSGLGTVELGAANTFTGDTTIDGGILRISHALALGTDAGRTTLNANGELELYGNGLTVDEPLTLNGGEICSLIDINTYHGSITLAADSAVDADSDQLIIASVIDGPYGLTKNGPGIVEFTGENLYTGSTTVNDGKLLVNNTSGSGTGTGAVTVNSGGALGGTGTIAGPVLVRSGATLAPRASSLTTLTVAGEVTLESGSMFKVEMSNDGTSCDKLSVSGVLTLNDATLNIGTISGTGCTIALNASSIVGSFSGLPDGAPLPSQPNGPYYIHYVDNGTDNSIEVNQHCAPALSTPTATSTRTGSATLGGTLTVNGGTPTRVYVCWGTTDAGSTVPASWNHYTDAGVKSPGDPFTVPVADLNEATVYYYNCLASNDSGTAWAGTVAWQSRQISPATWYLLSVPVGHTPPENNLNSTLGTQLASGLQAGANELSADSIWYWNGTTFVQYWLSGDGWKTTLGVDADLVLEPGDGFWVQRQTGSATTPQTLSGLPVTSVSPIRFGAGWNVFGWPYSPTGSDVSNAWGFEGNGVGGFQWDLADNMVGFYNGSYFSIYLRADGYWYNRGTSTKTTVKLEPGRAYYYYHRGSGFTWIAPVH